MRDVLVPHTLARILERGITLIHPYLGISVTERTNLFLLLFLKWNSKRKHGEIEVTLAFSTSQTLFII